MFNVTKIKKVKKIFKKIKKELHNDNTITLFLCFWADPLCSGLMWLWMSDWSFYTAHLEQPPKWCTYSAVWLLHGWCQVNLLPSQRTFCVHHTNHTPVYSDTLLKDHKSRIHTCMFSSNPAAISAHILCTPYNHAPVYTDTWFQNHKNRIHVCSALTLPPVLWAERPGSLTCCCGNTGVERISVSSYHSST